MSKLIYLDTNNVLCARKSCDICSHVSVCKFYNEAKKLFNSNEFYGINKYLESNNSLKAWSENSNCQFYDPFIFDKKLFTLETLKDASFINAFSWIDIIVKYFNINLFHKYEDYFKQELEKIKSNNTFGFKDKSDDELYSHCYYLSSTKHVYTIEAKNHEWKEVINLVDILEYFKAFRNS